MKSQILLMAQLLMARNVKVSNLEIKNAMHAAFNGDPTFSLRQSEVSSAMHELYVEQNWHRELNSVSVPGTPFYEYSAQPVVAIQPLPDAVIPVQSAVQTPSVNASASQPAAGTSKRLDPINGNIVCYVKQDPAKYFQGHDRSSARKNCFQQYNDNIFGLVYDNINTCTVAYYNKHKA